MTRDGARARSGASRTSLYDEITTKIIAKLEAGRVPRVQPGARRRQRRRSPCRRTPAPADSIPGSTC